MKEWMFVFMCAVGICFAADDEPESSLIMQVLETRVGKPAHASAGGRFSFLGDTGAQAEMIGLQFNAKDTLDLSVSVVRLPSKEDSKGHSAPIREMPSTGFRLVSRKGPTSGRSPFWNDVIRYKGVAHAKLDESLPGDAAELRYAGWEEKPRHVYLDFSRGNWRVSLRSSRMGDESLIELGEKLDDVFKSDQASTHFDDAVRSITRRNKQESWARRNPREVEADNLAQFEKLNVQLEQESLEAATREALIEEIAELSVKASVPLLDQVLRDQAETEVARTAALRSLAKIRPDMAWTAVRMFLDENSASSGLGSTLTEAASDVDSSFQRLTLLEILEGKDMAQQHAQLSLYVSLLQTDLLKNGKWFDRDWSQLESASLNDRATLYGYSTIAEAYGRVLDELLKQEWTEEAASRFVPLAKMMLSGKAVQTMRYAHLSRSERQVPRDHFRFWEIGTLTFAYPGGFESLDSWAQSLQDGKDKEHVFRSVGNGMKRVLDFWATQAEAPDRCECVLAFLTSSLLVESLSQPFYRDPRRGFETDLLSRAELLENHERIGNAYAENPTALWSLASSLVKQKTFAEGVSYVRKAIALVETKEAKLDDQRAEAVTRMLPMYRSTLAKALTANRQFEEAEEVIEAMSDLEAKGPRLAWEWSKALVEENADKKLLGLQSDLAKGKSWAQVALLCRLRMEQADDIVLRKLEYLCQVQAGREWHARELRESLLETLSDQSGIVLFKRSSDWRYHISRDEQKWHWYESEANDSAWRVGTAPIGYGNEGDHTELKGKPNTVYFRRHFQVSDVNNVRKLVVHLQHDDGAVVYLNGVEVVRNNMPSGKVGFGTNAKQAMGKPGYIPLEIPPSALLPGENLFAVEVHQASGRSSDLRFDLELVANGKAISSVLENLTVVDAKRALGMADAALPSALEVVIEEQSSLSK